MTESTYLRCKCVCLFKNKLKSFSPAPSLGLAEWHTVVTFPDRVQIFARKYSPIFDVMVGVAASAFYSESYLLSFLCLNFSYIYVRFWRTRVNYCKKLLLL